MLGSLRGEGGGEMLGPLKGGRRRENPGAQDLLGIKVVLGGGGR